MALRSIPPRTSTGRRSSIVSSMDAATRSGYTFVGPSMGGGIGSAGGSSGTEPTYKPHVVAPNPEMQRARKAFQEALGKKRDFWQDEISQLLEEFGGTEIRMSLLRLAERMGIELDQALGGER